ncbi:DoxX family protein [Mycolicibacillus trivialis]|uniref:DoxX family protein n=1 Tax=Mycolicibacillus trivialis TaxID=1798 RepID=A0A1X2EPZ4_9MYCO|nr:DoxX family protein [Mycolicibacillus trivialis]ORX08155.1 DoxX family protein [Mycolicibacillus trivialis]
MDLLILVGRILFAAVFLGGALGHFTNTAAMSGYAESMGVRPGRLFVLGSGVWQLLGGLSVLLGVWTDVGALMLLVFLLPTAVIMHRFWAADDAETRAAEQIHFNKDVSLAGASLILLGFVLKAGDTLGYTLTGPLLG